MRSIYVIIGSPRRSPAPSGSPQVQLQRAWPQHTNMALHRFSHGNAWKRIKKYQKISKTVTYQKKTSEYQKISKIVSINIKTYQYVSININTYQKHNLALVAAKTRRVFTHSRINKYQKISKNVRISKKTSMRTSAAVWLCFLIFFDTAPVF